MSKLDLELGGSFISELEKIALKNNWIKNAEFKGKLAGEIQKGINSVGDFMKILDPILINALPLEVDNHFGPDSTKTLNRIRSLLMNDKFLKLYDERVMPKLHEIRSKLHAPEGSAELWRQGLNYLEEIFLIFGTPEVLLKQKMTDSIPSGVPEKIPEHLIEKREEEKIELKKEGEDYFPSEFQSKKPSFDMNLLKNKMKEFKNVLYQNIKDAPRPLKTMNSIRMLILSDSVQNALGKDAQDFNLNNNLFRIACKFKNFDDATNYLDKMVKLVKKISEQNAIDKKAGLTAQQKKIVDIMMMKYKLSPNDALDRAKEKYPRIFSEKPLPEAKPKVDFDKENWWEDFSKMDIIEEVNKKMEDSGYTNKASSVIQELIVLANDLDEMGETKTAIVVDEQIKIYKEAMEKLYDITGETGEDLINRAHPGGGPTLFQANEEGGKVETVVEENKKLVEKSTKPPTGKYAETINRLVATANKLEEAGEIEAAKTVDKTIAELRGTVPFVNRSSVLGTTNSEDNKVSVKIAEEKKYTEIIPLWDSFIKDFNHFDKEIKGWTMGEVDNLRRAFEFATRIKNQIIKMWHVSSFDFLYNLFNTLYSTLVLDNKIFENMNEVFFKEKKVYLETKRYEEMLKTLDKIRIFLKNYNIKKDKKIKETGPQKQTEESLFEKKLKEMDPAKKRYIDQINDLIDSIIELMKNNIHKTRNVVGGGKNALVLKFYKDLNKLRKNLKFYSISNLILLNTNLYTYVYEFLKIKFAANIKHLIKTAAGLDLYTLLRIKQPTKEKTKTKYRGLSRKDEDQKVGELQQLLKDYGYNPGTVDKFWGKNTAFAYNEFIESDPRIKRVLTPVQNPKLQRHKDRHKVDLQRAINILKPLVQEKKAKGILFIIIGSGHKVPLYSLKNVQTFVTYMQRALNLKNYTPEDAQKHLQELSNYVNENQYSMSAGHSDAPKTWRFHINKISRDVAQLGNSGYSKSDPNKGVFMWPWKRPQIDRETGLMDPWANKKKQETQVGKKVEPSKAQPYVTYGKKLEGPLSTPKEVAIAIKRMPSYDQLTDKNMFAALAKGENVRDKSRYLKKLRDRIYAIFNAFNSDSINIRQTYPQQYNIMRDEIQSLFDAYEYIRLRPRDFLTKIEF